MYAKSKKSNLVENLNNDELIEYRAKRKKALEHQSLIARIEVLERKIDLLINKIKIE